MNVKSATWREISEDSAGEIMSVVETVRQFLSETKSGREFLEKYTEEDGRIPLDREIFRKDVAVLLDGLEGENEVKLAKLIRVIRVNICFILQLNKHLRGGKRTFNDYNDHYKRVNDANFFVDKSFLTRWFFSCSNYVQRREVVLKAIYDGIVLGVECFKTLVYDCCNNNVADEVSLLMRDIGFVWDEKFFLFCLRGCRDEASKISAIVVAYERITGKSISEFFKFAFLKCNSDIDFDWIFSVMRMAGFKLTDQFFVDCVLSAGGMNRRIVIHSIHLQRVGFKPSKAFFDAWSGVASGIEAGLVEKYASARR
jgi:hypothetical protein